MISQGRSVYAKYNSFQLKDETSQYKLYLSGFSGNTSDAMAAHNNMKFSTYDRDNDLYKTINCASKHKGGWWYQSCYVSNLNGIYAFKQKPEEIVWNSFGVTFVEMKVRRNI